MRQLRPKEGKWLAQGHTSNWWQSTIGEPGVIRFSWTRALAQRPTRKHLKLKTIHIHNRNDCLHQSYLLSSSQFKKKKRKKRGWFIHSSLMVKSLKTSAITVATPWGRVPNSHILWRHLEVKNKCGGGRPERGAQETPKQSKNNLSFSKLCFCFVLLVSSRQGYCLWLLIPNFVTLVTPIFMWAAFKWMQWNLLKILQRGKIGIWLTFLCLEYLKLSNNQEALEAVKRQSTEGLSIL